MSSLCCPLALLLVLLWALATAGCGSEDQSDPAGGGPSSQETQTETSPAKAQEQLKDTSTKPQIPKPTGSPPRRLVADDIVKGKGKAAKPGDNVTVQYVGVSFSTGEQFDASWDSGQPFKLSLGAGQVIPGWDTGILGMRMGGRRQLTIPPELAYGAEGYPPFGIAPNETVVLVIDLLSISRQS
jgi:peptidylprolyl isomerase